MSREIEEQGETGKTYGFLVVKRKAGKSKRGSLFVCLCKCGVETTVEVSNLRSGNTKSCGCSRRKHGFATRPLYRCWSGIKQRCYNPNSKYYRNYGKRGISLYQPWLNKPELFIRWVEKNLGPKPKGTSLDRINNDGNYVPGNLRWSFPREQMQNRRIVKDRNLPLGVYKSRNRYVVHLHIGSYRTIKKAKEAYVIAMELLHDSV